MQDELALVSVASPTPDSLGQLEARSRWPCFRYRAPIEHSEQQQ